MINDKITELFNSYEHINNTEVFFLNYYLFVYRLPLSQPHTHFFIYFSSKIFRSISSVYFSYLFFQFLIHIIFYNVMIFILSLKNIFFFFVIYSFYLLPIKSQFWDLVVGILWKDKLLLIDIVYWPDENWNETIHLFVLYSL